MELMSRITEMGHEEVVFFHARDLGLKAIVAIHDTTLGPALGGCRMLPYKSDDDALYDVLRLSRGMTYKNAVAGLELGGGKSVIIGDPKKDKSEAFFRAFGHFIESLGGRYITAEDVNTSVPDMEHIFLETDHVAGISSAFGGSGDPSPFTALGTFRGIEAAAERKYGSKDLSKLSFAVQGAKPAPRSMSAIRTRRASSTPSKRTGPRKSASTKSTKPMPRCSRPARSAAR